MHYIPKGNEAIISIHTLTSCTFKEGYNQKRKTLTGTHSLDQMKSFRTYKWKIGERQGQPPRNYGVCTFES